MAGAGAPLRSPARQSRCADRRRCSPRRWTRAARFRPRPRFGTIAVDTLDAKRKALNGVLKERGMKVSFTHLSPGRSSRRPRSWPVMVRTYRGARRQTLRARGRPGQPRHRRRRRAKGRLPQPHGPGDQGRRQPRFRRLSLRLRGADHQDPREQAQPRRLSGHQHLADQPRRDRHRRLGPAAAERPERDHRHRLDRLPAGVGPRRAGADPPARRLQGDDAHLDL